MTHVLTVGLSTVVLTGEYMPAGIHGDGVSILDGMAAIGTTHGITAGMTHGTDLGTDTIHTGDIGMIHIGIITTIGIIRDGMSLQNQFTHKPAHARTMEEEYTESGQTANTPIVQYPDRILPEDLKTEVVYAPAP